ncbi:MAG TPA: argininosuccinate lyase [Pyrinomonadaceae bacterium]|nr:argininosuccinate lyase [Pyrinomonadaceae bacterium]
MNKKLWGGRFKAEADSAFVEFNRSLAFDRRLITADVQASLAHCQGLVGALVLTREEGEKIESGLKAILTSSHTDPHYMEDPLVAEDIHSFVEARLVDLIGELGRKLHTGRSRNDQVATDLRIWIREAIDDLINGLAIAHRSLLAFAESNSEVVLPGYTHLQRAQPVLLAHWCLAYFEMLLRDRERLGDARRRVNVMPLGSAALAGTSWSIDRELVARELGFDGVTANSIDGVADRDFCVEFVSACALIMTHLSRLAEDIILYTTTEFGFFELSDTVATGSSLMPQKKNPDSMELVRGKAGRVFGDLQTLLAMLKGLPLAYNKDMQEDKEAVFDAFDTTKACLDVTATVLGNITINRERMHEAALKGYMNATELADYLVRMGMSFRDAHEAVGRIVLHAIDRGVELQGLPLQELQKFASVIDERVFEVLTLEQTLATKSQTGGTSRAQVSNALARARELIS